MTGSETAVWNGPGKGAIHLFLLLVLIAFAGCAAKKVPEGPRALMPATPEDQLDEGYSSSEDAAVFEGKGIKVTAAQTDGSSSGEFISEIGEAGYLLLRLEIENDSGANLVYQPSNTLITTNALDYRTPLNYTDLYDMALAQGRSSEVLRSISGEFYDLAESIPSGARSSRLLIFRPLSARASKAHLYIKDIYIGKKATDLFFTFSYDPRKASSDEAPGTPERPSGH